MTRKRFVLQVEIECDEIAADLLQEGLKRSPIRAALRLELGRALLMMMARLGFPSAFVDIKGGKLKSIESSRGDLPRSQDGIAPPPV